MALPSVTGTGSANPTTVLPFSPTSMASTGNCQPSRMAPPSTHRRHSKPLTHETGFSAPVPSKSGFTGS